MSTNFMKLAGNAIAVAAFALGLALPAQADETLSQFNFARLCSGTIGPGSDAPGFSGTSSGPSAAGVDVTLTVDDNTELEVLNGTPGTVDTITENCTVELGNDSELQLGEGTNLLFLRGDALKDFTIEGGEAGFEIEVQVKKNSRIVAKNFKIDIDGAEEAEAQFEENFCLKLSGDLTLIMNTGEDEGGDVQFKKFDVFSPDELCGITESSDPGGGIPDIPNIDVRGTIMISVGGEDDSEIQIEEFNFIKARGAITITGNGKGSQVQTKKGVTLLSDMGLITLSAPGKGAEVQVEERNLLDAFGAITLSAGSVGGGGKLNVKVGTVLDGDSIFLIGDAECKIEAAVNDWTPPTHPASCD